MDYLKLSDKADREVYLMAFIISVVLPISQFHWTNLEKTEVAK